MIDTDKYEGHTPAPWVWMEWNTYLAGGNKEGEDGKFLVQRPIEVADEDKVDGLLMADAPLLLKEIKRMREDTLKVVLDWFDGCENEWRKLEQALGLPLTPLSWEVDEEGDEE